MNKSTLPILSDIQLPPIKNDEKFEEFIVDLFNDIEDTNSYDRYGTRGQKQDGIDIFSTCKKTIIQCKLKTITRSDSKIRKDLITDINTDYLQIIKILENYPGKFNRIIFATTFKNDTHIHKFCIEKSSRDLLIEYWCWEKITSKISSKIFGRYYADLIKLLQDYYNTPVKPTNNHNTFSIDNKLSVLDQIYQYFSLIYKEINFVPIHLLKANFPIKLNNGYYTDYSLFNLSITNSNLFDFFKSLKISKNNTVKFEDKSFIKGVNKYEYKTKYVLEKLTNNLVFKLSLAKSQEVVSVLYLANNVNNKLSFNYDRLKFVDLFTLIKKRENNINKLIKLAYINYQLGNFISSANLFISISRKAKINKNKTIYFIAEYNLSKLAILIRNCYWQNYEAEKLYQKLKQIDIEKEFKYSLTEQNEKLISWIKSNDFINEAHENIHQIVNDIRDQYYSQLNGGFSRNNNVTKLINEYANLNSFLNENFIIYNAFSVSMR